MGSGWRAQAGAALVVFHLTATTLMALPSPGSGLRRSAWADPTVQAEFAAWTKRLQALGWSGDQKQFEDHLWTVATSYTEARSSVLDPLRPYYTWSGSWQSWQMFVAPHRYPARLVIQVRMKGKSNWTTLYRPRDPDAAWRRHQWENDRMRSAVFRYSWAPYKNTWKRFARRVAFMAWRDHPDLAMVRVRYIKSRTPSPEETRDGIWPEETVILDQRFPRSLLQREAP